jgi:hypothetical protein
MVLVDKFILLNWKKDKKNNQNVKGIKENIGEIEKKAGGGD